MKKFSIVVLVCAVSLAASADLELGGFGAMWGATGTENQQMNTLDPTLNDDEKTYSLHQEWSFENNCDLTLDLTDPVHANLNSQIKALSKKFDVAWS